MDLAISPCPNDTFIFAHLIRDGYGGESIHPHLEDVEELNRRAIEEQRHALTKLSFFAALHLSKEYEILGCGGALGQGCGPLLITSSPQNWQHLLKKHPRILIPGKWTTANLLVHLWLAQQGWELREIEFVPVRYDRIMPLLVAREENFGLIIHEDRFTYQARGLSAVQDLGAWWEIETGQLIPLGCVALRRDLVGERVGVEAAIRASLAKARAQPESVWPFVKQHAQSMEDEVIQAHIDLYVNDYSLASGPAGETAIHKLRELALQARL